LWPESKTMTHHVFKLPNAYNFLVPDHHHRYNKSILQFTRVGFPLHTGDVPYCNLKSVLNDAIANASIIYVYGDKKTAFVQCLLENQSVEVCNIKNWMEYVEVRKRVINTQINSARNLDEDDGNVSCCFKRKKSQKEFEQLCSKHSKYFHFNSCAIYSDFSRIANAEYCRFHIARSVSTCALKRCTLFGLYIKSEKDGCSYVEQK
jgi:hypothetical protein